MRTNTGDEEGAAAALNDFTQEGSMVDLVIATDTAHCLYLQREQFMSHVVNGAVHVLHMLPVDKECEVWDNVSAWNQVSPQLDQAVYLTGKALAGTTPGPYCFLAPLNISLVTKMINAFTLGVRSERPAATVEVVYTGSWFSGQTETDEGCESRAAKWFLSHGCNGLASYTDSPIPQRVFSAAGKMSVGAKIDFASLTTPGERDPLVLTSAVFNWEIAYLRAIQALRQGTWQPAHIYRDHFDTGVLSLAEMSWHVSEDLAERVLALKQHVADNATLFEDTGAEENRVVSGVVFPWGEGVMFPCEGKCNPGEYKGARVGVDSCQQCPAGTYNSEADSILYSCTNCQAGTFSTGGASTCTPCPAGTISTASKATECTPCPIGTYSVEGATECTPCPPGTYSNAEATAECTPCPVGQYQPASQSTSCITCQSHTTTGAPGATNQSFCRCVEGYQQSNDDNAFVAECTLNERGALTIGLCSAAVVVIAIANIILLVHFVPALVHRFVV